MKGGGGNTARSAHARSTLLIDAVKISRPALRAYCCALALLSLGASSPVRAHAFDPFDPGLVSLRQGTLTQLRGRSGKLQAHLVSEKRSGIMRVLREFFGDSASQAPGVYMAREERSGPFAFINMLPFEIKRRGLIGRYLLGIWPAERRRAGDTPEGFIEVTEQNQDVHLSEHFTLRDFLTKDQASVWPKYLVLREPLLDKLELVIQELSTQGVRVREMSVLSGFRTPQYNAKGIGQGRAPDSRHQHGDAADVYVDNNGDGRMDDLNGDGRVDLRDARVILSAVERVEARYPELVGGAGLYKATRAHGPFLHIDVRGTRTRWGA